ncbi:MAG: aspartate/glutamate racemase family protein [Rhodospirillaceae bacterium]|nr:aspartate/glutamate racemase family protein [Rhodospirillaceae bacterium]
MKTIGLIGGMSWESTALYYKFINEEVKRRLGGLNSAKLLICSVNFAEIEPLQRSGRWEEAGRQLNAAALALEGGGADLILICTNTMHIVFDEISQGVSPPVLHIADATAAEIERQGLRRVALLGTAFTMSEPFYRSRLADRHGVDVLVPGEEDQARLHGIIYEELCRGVVSDAAVAYARDLVASLAADGAEGVILGCTELGLLIKEGMSPVPVFDTTSLHAIAAVEAAL